MCKAHAGQGGAERLSGNQLEPKSELRFSLVQEQAWLLLPSSSTCTNLHIPLMFAQIHTHVSPTMPVLLLPLRYGSGNRGTGRGYWQAAAQGFRLRQDPHITILILKVSFNNAIIIIFKNILPILMMTFSLQSIFSHCLVQNSQQLPGEISCDFHLISRKTKA